jgi:hypothetical protein
LTVEDELNVKDNAALQVAYGLQRLAATPKQFSAKLPQPLMFSQISTSEFIIGMNSTTAGLFSNFEIFEQQHTQLRSWNGWMIHRRMAASCKSTGNKCG